MADTSEKRRSSGRAKATKGEPEAAKSAPDAKAKDDAAPGPGAPDEALTLQGEELDEAASDLDIQGRSEMSADEKRAAVAAERARRAEPGPGSPDDRSEQAPTSAQGAFPKEQLVARADKLLGVPSAVARGVLHEEGDYITVDAARERIDTFLTNPVVKSEEA